MASCATNQFSSWQILEQSICRKSHKEWERLAGKKQTGNASIYAPKKRKKKGDFAEMAYQIQEQKACEEAAAKKLERWVFLCFSVPGKRELQRREAATWAHQIAESRDSHTMKYPSPSPDWSLVEEKAASVCECMFLGFVGFLIYKQCSWQQLNTSCFLHDLSASQERSSVFFFCFFCWVSKIHQGILEFRILSLCLFVGFGLEGDSAKQISSWPLSSSYCYGCKKKKSFWLALDLVEIEDLLAGAHFAHPMMIFFACSWSCRRFFKQKTLYLAAAQSLHILNKQGTPWAQLGTQSLELQFCFMWSINPGNCLYCRCLGIHSFFLLQAWAVVF